MNSWIRFLVLSLLLGTALGCSHVARRSPAGLSVTEQSTQSAAPPDVADFPVVTLESDARWLLTPPEPMQFDASSILRLPDGTWLTVNDKGWPVYEIRLGNPPEAHLFPRYDLFPRDQVDALRPPKPNRWDLEGLALDSRRRLYVCDERDRWILRHDPDTDRVERLDIDWSGHTHRFHREDTNASFEGLAVGPDDVLYVANERQQGIIFKVDPDRLVVIDSFVVRPQQRPKGDVQYSALSFFGGRLWVLCRQDQCVLEVDPATHRVVAQYDYSAIERASENAYLTGLPVGLAEGLHVDERFFWIVIDNNGLRRRADLRDRRPLLFRAPRVP